MKVWRPKSAYQAKQEGDWQGITCQIADLWSEGDVDAYWTGFLLNRARDLPGDWIEEVKEACRDRKDELRAIRASQEMDAAWAERISE